METVSAFQRDADARRWENAGKYTITQRTLALSSNHHVKLRASRVLEFAIEIAGALDAAHSRAVIHRDIRWSRCVTNEEHNERSQIQCECERLFDLLHC